MFYLQVLVQYSSEGTTSWSQEAQSSDPRSLPKVLLDSCRTLFGALIAIAMTVCFRSSPQKQRISCYFEPKCSSIQRQTSLERDARC